MPITHVKGTPTDRAGMSERIVIGPYVFRSDDPICRFEDPVQLDRGEVAVQYMNADYIHDAAHWAIGSMDEIVAWLLDEAAVSPRKKSLLAQLAVRLLMKQCAVDEEPARALEQSIAAAVEGTR